MSVRFNHGFQPLALGDLLKARRNIVQAEPVCDPGRSIYHTLFDHADDARKMSGAVTGRQQGELAVVKKRVVDGRRAFG